MTVEDVTESQWDEKILSQDHIAVDFWAPWCGFCKQLEPVYQQVSDEINDMKFAKVNVQDETGLAQRYGVQGIPAIKFFCHGKEVGGVTGYRSKDKLIQDIRRVLSEDESCAANSSNMKQ